MRLITLLISLSILVITGCTKEAPTYTGFWKTSCSDGFGVQIKPVKEHLYSVSFCGPGGCFEPGTWVPNTAIDGDPSYKVYSASEIEIKNNHYLKCTNDPTWNVTNATNVESKDAVVGVPVEKERGIIFALRDYTHSNITFSGTGKDIQTLIEPFAFIEDGKLVQLPENLIQDQFANVYYLKNHQYELFAGGSSSGSVEVLQPAFDVQCESYAGIASVKPPNQVTGMRMALASNVKFHDIGYVRREPSVVEKQSIKDLANRIYADNKIPKELYEHATKTNITVIEGKSDSMIIGSFVADQQIKQGGYDNVNTHAVFLIAEKNKSGVFEVKYSWFHSGIEADVEMQDLVDVLDIDGDGMPEIITQFGYYEAVEYHVYKKKDGRWEDIYKQFGSGC